MSTKKEIERKFLVELPLSADARAQLKEFPPAQIIQVYMVPEVNGTVERVRMSSIKLMDATFTHYYHTVKRHVSAGINDETEIDLNKKQYDCYLKHRVYNNRVPVIKDRHLIDWKGKTFELDIFHGANEGLAVLEIELEDIEETFELPPFINIVREVTEEKEFSNFNLAFKKV